MKKWFLYRHTSPSGKVYIGITSRLPILRWGSQGVNYRGYTHFVAAIKKYGWDNIKHEILFADLTEEHAKQLEIELIRHYKNLGISYNMTDGGDGAVGFHHSEESRARMSAAQRKLDHTKRISTLNNNREQIGLKHRKPVMQFTLKGVFVARYEGTLFASKATGIDSSMITSCCKGKQNKAGGFLWIYESEYKEALEEEAIEIQLKEKAFKASKIPGTYERDKEWRKKKSEQLKGKDIRSNRTKKLMQQRSVESRSKAIMQLSLDNQPIKTFKNGSEIKKELGFCNSYISKCCNGKKESAYGYKWKFVDSI